MVMVVRSAENFTKISLVLFRPVEKPSLSTSSMGNFSSLNMKSPSCESEMFIDFLSRELDSRLIFRMTLAVDDEESEII